MNYRIFCFKHFFQKNPDYYDQFRTELTSIGLELPILDKLDLSPFTDKDFELIKQLTKDTTFKQALSLDYISSLLVIIYWQVFDYF